MSILSHAKIFVLIGLFLSLSIQVHAEGLQAVASKSKLTFKLVDGNSNWPADKRQSIVNAMESAVAIYSQLCDFDNNCFNKTIYASYNPGTPTADCNYEGYLRFGGSISTRVALHEIGHALGIGTHPNWDKFVKDGKWTGGYAIAQLKAFDGPDAVLHCDRMHFWPYGLNYDSEITPNAFRRHVLMIAAFRRDLGITPTGEPLKGMIGVATWGTQAEFKDVIVSKNSALLYTSNFSRGFKEWKTVKGDWKIIEGALQQMSSDEPAIAVTGNADWSDYTLTLKARKISGNEGFLIVVGSNGDGGECWWNIGGWGNTKDAIQIPGFEGVGTVPDKIETGRWYDIRIELNGSHIKCYLDGKLIQEGSR